MKIDTDECTNCGLCIPYCPVSAIVMKEDTCVIDLDECVECACCLRSEICPVDAIVQQELKWPRTIRSIMSDVFTLSEETGISGRGTEEMKTNDVTGRFTTGYAGIAVEVGRPVLGARFHEIEKIAMGIGKLGSIRFEPANPITHLMTDPETGKFKEDILDEKVLSAILEFSVPIGRVPELLDTLSDIASEIETVFSLDIITKVSEDDSLPTEEVVRKAGYWISVNGKTNVGLGRK